MRRHLAHQRSEILPPLWIIFSVIFLGLIWLAYELREIVVLLVVGYCIAYVLEPILQFLEKKKMARPVGVLVSLSAIVLIIVGLFFTALPVLFREYGKLSDNMPEYLNSAMALIEREILPLLPVPPGEEELQGREGVMGAIVGVLSPASVGSAVQQALLSGYSVTLTLVNLALLPFIVFYLSVDFSALHSKLLQLLPRDLRPPTRRMALQIDKYVAAFVRGQLTVCSILFVMYAFGLGILGIDLWLLMAVISGFGNLIPYVGTIIGITLSSIMAAVTFGSMSQVLAVWAIFAVIQFLEGSFITPKIVGNKVGLSPLVIILALFAGGQLFGLIGIFLAVPIAAVIRVVGGELRAWLIRKYQESTSPIDGPTLG